MTINSKIEPYIINTIDKLQSAGFETYLVGGAVRDILLDIKPKDYDIATEATPEETRKVFGKRYARIIGKRFRIVHLYYKRYKYIEISTFRKSPNGDKPEGEGKTERILRDNIYGTAYEDAWRRDFSINSIFYDPVADKYIDYTENGLQDLKDGIVRSIGDPVVRFHEDPVRIIRALKLVGQYNFKLTDDIIDAIPKTLHCLPQCSSSRLLLELEKILRKPYSVNTFKIFRDFGVLSIHFPFLYKNWNTGSAKTSIELLKKYNVECILKNRISHYTTSLALICIPFINCTFTEDPNNFQWRLYPSIEKDIKRMCQEILQPYALPGFRMTALTSSIILTHKMYYRSKPNKIFNNRYFKTSRDILDTLNNVFWQEKNLMPMWYRKRKNYRNKAYSSN